MIIDKILYCISIICAVTMIIEPIIINYIYMTNPGLFIDIILTEKSENKLKEEFKQRLEEEFKQRLKEEYEKRKKI